MFLNQPTNILVVEDDVDDTFLLTRVLERALIKDSATIITNGLDALDYLSRASRPPLVIFLDLRLPGLSGIELLQKIRKKSPVKDVPVIIMTGSTDPNDLKQCVRLGVTAFLSKPIELTTFIKTVAHLFPQKSGLN